MINKILQIGVPKSRKLLKVFRGGVFDFRESWYSPVYELFRIFIFQRVLPLRSWWNQNTYGRLATWLQARFWLDICPNIHPFP